MYSVVSQSTINVMHRPLGIILICVAVIQAALYTAVRLGGDSLTWLFYFDPRIGWFMFETSVRQQESFPAVTSWLTAATASLVGVSLIRNPARMPIYLVAEAIMALPTLAMFVLVAVANISPAHGFSVGELLIPVPIFIMVSIVPLTIGYRSRKAG